MTEVVIVAIGAACLILAAFLASISLGFAVLGGILLSVGLFVDFRSFEE